MSGSNTNANTNTNNNSSNQTNNNINNSNNNTLQQQQQPQQMAVIKRHQHNLKLANMLNQMLQCGSLVDVTIYCDDGQVNAHKLVLAASSSYFRNLFSRMNHAFHYPIIVLREMLVNDLKTIIQFIYHGEVSVPQNRVDTLMRCANYLQIDGMASSANSLNAILATSANSTSMSSGGGGASHHHNHHPLLTAGGHHGSLQQPMSSIANNNTTATTLQASAQLNKIHPQYLSASSDHLKPIRGHSSRSNHGGGGSSSRSNNQQAGGGGGGDQNPNKPKHTCTVCLKTFTHGFTLKRHMKLHSTSRHPIFCDVCSKSYSCKDSFLRHKKSSGHLQHAGFHHRSLDMNLGTDR